jgi:hypothetical protein
MKYLLLLYYSALSLTTWAQGKDSAVVPVIPDTAAAHNLAPVNVHTNTYKADSIRNRAEYENTFDYKRKKINMGDNKWDRSIVVMGKKVALTPQDKLSLLDINSLATHIHSKKNNQKRTLQKRLIQQEQENYVYQIFTPALVERFSNMHNDDSLHLFIARYAPPYDQIQTMNELDLGSYILTNMKLFRQQLPAKDTLIHK